ERSLRGAGLPYYSIQVGLSRHVIREYVDEWVVRIEDCTPRVRKIYDLLHSGQADKAKRLLPPERVYPVTTGLGRRLRIEGSASKAEPVAAPDRGGRKASRDSSSTRRRGR